MLDSFIRENWTDAGHSSEDVRRMWDDRSERFISGPFRDLEMGWPSFVREVTGSVSGRTVLDVGCGAGGYSLPFADEADRILGLDISPKLVRAATEAAESMGASNAEYRECDWKTADAGDLGTFDLVIAHMTPAVSSYDSFMKLVAATGRDCLVTRTVHRENSATDLLRFRGIDVESDAAGDMVFILNILWNMGLEPTLRYKERRFSEEIPLEDLPGRIAGMCGKCDMESALEALSSESRDGTFTLNGRSLLATVHFRTKAGCAEGD